MGVLQKVTMEKAFWDGIMESLKEDEFNYDQAHTLHDHLWFAIPTITPLFLFIISSYFDIQV